MEFSVLTNAKEIYLAIGEKYHFEDVIIRA